MSKLKNLAKKWYFWVILVIVIGVIGLFGGSDEPSTTNAPVDTTVAIVETQAPADSIDDVQCEIVSATLGNNTYDGEPTVVITYKFTNTSANPASFYTTFTDTVYQNGIECEKYWGLEETNEDKEIKPGASLEVVLAYILNDTTSDVEVELTGWASLDESVITKTFKISE